MDHKFKPMTAYRNENSHATWDIFITRIFQETDEAVYFRYLFMDRLGFLRDLPPQEGRILYPDFNDWVEVEFDVFANN